MTTGLYPRDLAREWAGAAILIQSAVIFAALIGFYGFGWVLARSPIELYALLNLIAAQGLGFVAASSRKMGAVARIALIGAPSGFGLLLPILLGLENAAHDWGMMMLWLVSAGAIGTILRFHTPPTAVSVALALAVFAQGGASIGDMLAEESHVSYDSMLIWLHAVALALSMAGYQVGFQYLAQEANTLGSALGRRRIRDVYSFWKHALPKSAKHRLMVGWYNLVAHIDAKGELLFMNHGYAPAGLSGQSPPISADLEHLRYPIQLYDLVASKVDWRGKEVLEVSSGLGGGALWISRAYQPKSVTGLDIAERSVRKCRDRYGHLGIDFEIGDAQEMPFSSASFDIVVNIESSLNYSDMRKFLAEVDRVLRPGGNFLFADYRRQAKMPRLWAMLTGMGFEVVSLEDVTRGILRGIEYEEQRKAELISRKVPRLLRSATIHFAGLGKGERNEREQFEAGKKSYVAAVLQKRS